VPGSLSSQIHDVLPKTQDTYYKLILAVGPARTGKTAALTELAAKHRWPRVNVNLCLSEKLLELTHRQRAVRVAGVLDETVRAESSNVVLLDNIERAIDRPILRHQAEQASKSMHRGVIGLGLPVKLASCNASSENTVSRRSRRRIVRFAPVMPRSRAAVLVRPATVRSSSRAATASGPQSRGRPSLPRTISPSAAMWAAKASARSHGAGVPAVRF
jgi:hypothetical protein